MTFRWIITATGIVLLFACQSTQAPQGEAAIEDLYVFEPQAEHRLILQKLPVPTAKSMGVRAQQDNFEQQSLPPSQYRKDKDEPNDGKQENKIKASDFLNQEVCRDNVEVTYRVTDQNAVTGVYNAKVQAQAIIVLISEDRKHLKLRVTGWYTNNENLYRWQPYLKQPPIAKDISVVKGAEFWDEVENWYLCGKIKA